MKRKSSGKRRWKQAAAALLIFALCAGLGGAYLAMVFQPPAVVQDYTAKGGKEPSQKGPTGGAGNGGGDSSDGAGEAEAVLNPNVKVFAQEEAEKINQAISNVTLTSGGIYLDVADGTGFSDLGVGDIFYLDGDEDTPLGEIYIGKVSQVSRREGEKRYQVQAPTVDEAFDVLDINYSQVMTADKIQEIETVPGITASVVEDVPAQFAAPDSAEGQKNLENWKGSLPGRGPAASSPVSGAVSNMTYRSLSRQPVIQTANTTLSSPEGIVFTGSVDLLKTFGLKKESSEFFEQYDAAQGGSTAVYITTTGMCYHRENCACVGRSKYPSTLSEAVLEGYEPCYLCNPPVFQDRKEESLELNMKAGVTDIVFSLDYDWDILNGNGIEQLAMSAQGNFMAEMELKASMKYEIGGETTEYALPFDSVKLEGLREKMFPVAFIGYNGTIVTTMGGNQGIRALTGVVPITVGAVIYVDIYGNLSVGARAYVNYNQGYCAQFTVVRDGQWVWEEDFQKEEPKIGMGIGVEVSGDVDVCAGASICAYVFNLNLAELAVVKAGGEAEGNIQLVWSNDQDPGENGLSGSYYMRIYLKLFEINVKLKAKVKILVVDAGLNLDYSHTCLDFTLAEWGSKSPTRFQEGLMGYSPVTAWDSEAVYYKDTDGSLVREEEAMRTTLYSEEFFSICGIDESFLYVLRANDSGSYDVYRISKRDGTNKRVLEEVSQCLAIDENWIYYVSEFDLSSIYRMNRENLKEETFASFGDEVRFMEPQGDGYYVVTEDGGIIAQLLGGGRDYYLLDESGNVLEDYGSSPQVSQYYRSDEGNYFRASLIVSGGYLRSTALEEYWMSKDQFSSVQAEGVSGWNPQKRGIFTTQESKEGSALPYEIVLYRAEDGAMEKVAEVGSDQAFFTLCQSGGGDWYFFDQTDSQLILYGMSENFQSRWIEKEFSLEEMPCNLTDCAMTILEDRIYFYTMPDQFTSTVLYRYDLI